MKYSLILLLAISEAVYAYNGLPDPTRPANYILESVPVFVEQIPEPGQKLSWQVSAIRISSNDRSAIVNGKLVRVGDKVSLGTVLEINPTSVVVDHKQQKLIVRLFNNQVDKKYKPNR